MKVDDTSDQLVSSTELADRITSMTYISVLPIPTPQVDHSPEFFAECTYDYRTAAELSRKKSKAN
jgi:hypothetical protein